MGITSLSGLTEISCVWTKKIVTSYVTKLFQLWRSNRMVWNGRLEMDGWIMRIWKVAAVRAPVQGTVP